MSKPNFWRLKRKAKEKADSSALDQAKLSQKTIASFFGAKKSPTNLGDRSQNTSLESLDSQSSFKRQKLDEDNEPCYKEKTLIKLSDTALTKLKSFSSKQGNDTDSMLTDCDNDSLKAKCSLTPDSSHDEEIIRKVEEADKKEEEDLFIQEVPVSAKSNLENFKSNIKSLTKTSPTFGNQGKFAKVKYTPLEQQVLDLWNQHPGLLLFVECGYKYRFFGKDAEIAAQELNIYAHVDHNFMTASIPVHRLHAHVSRLVMKGYKVGVVKQIETAALKASSDNKNAPFSRRLEQIYTRATLIGEDVDSIDQNLQSDEGIPAGHIFCFHETNPEPKVTNIAFVAVNPSTGECLYEQFFDNSSREELQKRLQIINPAEILCPTEVSSESDRLLNHSDARLERLQSAWFETTDALTRVVSYFASSSEEKSDSTMLEQLTELPLPTLSCMAALLQHLTEFGLHRAISPLGLKAMTTGGNFLHIDSSTIRNLQLLVSDSGTVRGSLFWALNHTKTKFGARLLHRWLIQPVRVKSILEERQESIKELLLAEQLLVDQLKNLLSNLPDLEKGLTTILHTKCSPLQYFTILDALCSLSSDLSSLVIMIDQDRAPLLANLISSTISLLEDVQTYRDNVNVAAAKDGDKTKLLKDFSAFPSVLSLLKEIESTKKSLDDLRPDIARKLSQLSVQFTCVSGQEYLIEVKNTNAKSVPGNWRKVSCTKQVGRYRPPAVDLVFGELQRQREKLKAECHLAWIGLLQDFSLQYFKHKQAVLNVATLDVHLSLTHIAQQEGYSRPKLLECSEGAQITIKKGRHPVVPLLFRSAEQFVPNDTNLTSSGECCMVLSGPNMGGKSCYIRQVALITLLAHIGSYVPAEYAEITMLDSIFTRMGARDELFQGRSTLMVELEETASILKKVSRNSLVLLDELGRGTGSCDGSAIACATLHHIALDVQCLTLFVTHYPSVMDTVKELNGKAANYHMAFLLHDQDGGEFLTFLYEVVRGAAERSYGINVARLANLGRHLLDKAASVAAELEIQARRRRDIRKLFLEFWQ